MPDTTFFNQTSLCVDETNPPEPTPLVELLGPVLCAAVRRARHQRGLKALRRSGHVIPIGRGNGQGVRMLGVERGGRPGA